MSSAARSRQPGVSLRGPEGRNVISNLTESEVRAFFQQVAGWHLVFKEVDVRIGYNLPLPIEDFEEKDRGIDFLFSVFNPFVGRKEGILVETKHVKAKRTLYARRLQKYVDTLKWKLDGIRTSSSFQHDPDVLAHIDGTVDYGMLVLRFRQFDREHFYRLCSQVDTSLHRGSDIPVIAVLSNDRMSAFIELRRRAGDGTLEFYYPRYLSNPKPRYIPCLSLSYMLSDWVLGAIRLGKERQKFILSFDEPSPEFFNLLYEIYQEFKDDNLFPGIDEIFFVNADYESKSLYEQRLKNSPISEIGTPRIVILRQDLNMSYDIAEELQWRDTDI